MSFVIEAPPNRKLFSAAIKRIFRNWIWAIRALILVMLLAVLTFLWLNGKPAVGISTFVVCSPLIFTAGWFLVWSTLRTNARMLTTPATYAVSEAGINARSALGRSEIPWTSFTEAHELPGQIALRLDAAFISLPTATLSADQASELTSWLAKAGVAVR